MILEAAAAPAEASASGSAQHCSYAAPEMERAALPSSGTAVHTQVLAGWDKELETCWPLEFQTSCIMISVRSWITVSATLGRGYSNSLWNIKKCSLLLSKPFTALIKEDGADQDIASAAWAGEGVMGSTVRNVFVCWFSSSGNEFGRPKFYTRFETVGAQSNILNKTNLIGLGTCAV